MITHIFAAILTIWGAIDMWVALSMFSAVGLVIVYFPIWIAIKAFKFFAE